MRILHVTESVKGGIATYLQTIAPRQLALFSAGEVTFLVTPDGAETLTAIPASSRRCVARVRGSRTGLLRYTWDVCREVRRIEPDLIHAHSTFPGLVIRVLRAFGLHRARVVYCAHGWSFDREDGFLRPRLYRLLERLLAPLSERIVCISKYEYRQGRAAGIPRTRLALVYNGVPDLWRQPPPAHEPEPGPSDVLRLVFLGRIDHQKGLDILVDALRRLDRPWRLVCIGARVLDDGADCERETQQGRIHYRGWLGTDDIGRELAASDAVVVPSRWEGFGLVAAEAMRQGKAVVASRVGGLPEVVVDGETGRLAAPGDATGLARVLNGLRHAELRAWGAAGRRRYRDFFTSTCLHERLGEIYRGLEPD